MFFVYAMRRVDCRRCGVRVERVPWAEGKSSITTTYAWFLAGWAKRLSWKEVSEAFRTSWDSVYRAVGLAVAWGLAHRNLDGIAAIGVDEVQADEAKRMQRDGYEPLLKDSWWALLKNPENLTSTLRSHRTLILNWFKAKGMISAGIVEGFNNKLKVTFRRAYGYKHFNATEIALYHTLGQLPEPNFTHRFF